MERITGSPVQAKQNKGKIRWLKTSGSNRAFCPDVAS